MAHTYLSDCKKKIIGKYVQNKIIQNSINPKKHKSNTINVLH